MHKNGILHIVKLLKLVSNRPHLKFSAAVIFGGTKEPTDLHNMTHLVQILIYDMTVFLTSSSIVWEHHANQKQDGRPLQDFHRELFPGYTPTEETAEGQR